MPDYQSASDGVIAARPTGPTSCPSGFVGVSSGSLFGCFADSENQVDTQVVSFTGRLDWQVRERWSTFVQYRFRDQEASGDIRVRSYDDHRLMVGFRYAFPLDFF